MIYLFNSAYRSLYQGNLLATLFLPYGWTNEYRYLCSPQRRNVSEDFISDVEKLTGKEDAVIVFINRFGKDANNNDAYEYYPIRRATFLSCGLDGEQLYVRVRLLDYVFPIDISSFAEQLVASLTSKNLPKLTNNDPQEKDDGYYAIYTDNIKFLSGDNAWERCVAAISKTKPFESSTNRQVLFARLRLCEHGKKERMVYPDISNNPWYQKLWRRVNNGEAFYKLTRNRKYDLRINYVFPIQDQDTNATANLSIRTSGNIVPAGQEFLVSSRASRITFSFMIGEPNGERMGKFVLTFSPKNKTVAMLAPKRDQDIVLDFQVSHSRRYWAALAALIILIILGGTFIGTYSAENGVLNVFDSIKSDWPKLIAAAVQAVAIYLLFRLTGRKLL